MRFRVDLAVRKGWRIPSDSIAAIQAPGLLSAIVIAISEGTGRTSLKPGDRIESREAENLFSVMSSVAGQVKEFTEKDLRPLMATLNGTLVTVNDIMGSQGKVLVSELSNLATDLANQVPKVVGDMQALTGQMQKTAGEVDKLFRPRAIVKPSRRCWPRPARRSRISPNFPQNLQATRTRIDKMLETLDTMLIDNKLDVERSIIDLRHVVDSVAQHIDTLNQNMEGASRNMYEFSRQIRENPGLLLGGTPPKDQAAGKGR